MRLPDDFQPGTASSNADHRILTQSGWAANPIARVDVVEPHGGGLTVSNPDQNAGPFPYESLRSIRLLEAGQATTQLLLASEGLGDAGCAGAIDDPNRERPPFSQISYRANESWIFLRPFWLRSKQPEGRVNGRGRSCPGTLASRGITGRYSAARVATQWSELPYQPGANSPLNISGCPAKRAQR